MLGKTLIKIGSDKVKGAVKFKTMVFKYNVKNLLKRFTFTSHQRSKLSWLINSQMLN